MMRRCLTLIARDFYRESHGRKYYVEGINRIRYYLIEYEQLRNGAGAVKGRDRQESAPKDMH